MEPNLYPDGGASHQPEFGSFLFFSTESKAPAAMQIMQILQPVNTFFAEKYPAEKFSDNIDTVAIIPNCIPEDMIQDGWHRERRYVSLKKRYADVRLYIPYDAFVRGDKPARIYLCAKNIADAVSYVKKKDKTFDDKKFMSAIGNAFEFCHGVALKDLPERYFE